jgi:sulfate permease, SulP family
MARIVPVPLAAGPPVNGTYCSRRGRNEHRTAGVVTFLRRVVPAVAWLPGYDRADLRYDAIAGISVAALVVPKALGYAGIAQVPLENGLYAAAAGALLYALFGTSRQISTGPSSALATVAGGAAITSGLAQGDETAQLVAAITITTGLLYLLMAVFRMGWIARFLSQAVITGFLFGAAIDVVVGELAKVSGTETDGDNVWQELHAWLGTVGDFHGTTFAVAVVSLTVILVLRFTVPKAPGALLLVVGGLVASDALDLAAKGVATVGEVPRGLPVPLLPDLDLVTANAATIGIAGLALVLIGFSQTAGDARVFASRHHYAIDVDQEAVAQGVANLGAGFFQGMPVSTSLSASSLADASGARTGVASLVTGATVILTLLVLAPLFSDLPKPVLAAIIIDAVVFGMMDVPEMRRLWRVKRPDFWIAVAAVLGVLSAGVLAGVVIGMVLSLAWVVYVSTHPATPELGREPGSSAFQDLAEHPDSETYPGVFIFRFDGGLSFVTADVLDDLVRRATHAEDRPVTAVVIDFGGVNFIDSQGSAQVGELVRLTAEAGVSLRLARVKPEVLVVLRSDGVATDVGEERIHPNLDDAVTTELAEQA